MVAVTRIGRIGNDPKAALAFAVEMTQYFKQKYGESASCWARVGGPTGQIAWRIDLPDMSAVQKFNEQILADDEYWKRVERARSKELFDATTFEDGLWNQIA
jgi:hypothetical protein